MMMNKIIWWRVAAGLAVMTGFWFSGGWVEAQNNLEGVANYLPVEGDEISDGDMVVLDGDVFKRSYKQYDSDVYGVVNIEPAVGLSIEPGENKQPIINDGVVHVKVSSANGNIPSGSYITTSDIPGVGMLATVPGVVLGTALQEYTSDDPNAVGQIKVVIDLRYVTLLDGRELQERSVAEQARQVLQAGAATIITEPNTALKYAIAAVVAMLALALGFIVFGRSATHGIMAIGRNPLAKKSILLAVSFNVFMVVVFAGAGVAVAFFILAT